MTSRRAATPNEQVLLLALRELLAACQIHPSADPVLFGARKRARAVIAAFGAVEAKDQPTADRPTLVPSTSLNGAAVL
jgi:hypothetical protein